jgi:hypothetical protein
MLALETARFAVGPADADALIRGHAGMIAALARRCPGLRRAYLTRLDEARWAHVLEWDDREQALEGVKAAPSIPECAAWLGKTSRGKIDLADVEDIVEPEAEDGRRIAPERG